MIKSPFWLHALLGAMLCFLSSCDMPSPEPEIVHEPATVTTAPWITTGADLSLYTSFTTDRPIQPGVRIFRSGTWLVTRTGVKSTRHTLRLPPLEPGTYRCEVIAGVPLNPYSFPLIVPAADKETTIAFLDGGWESPETLAATIDGLNRTKPSAVFLAGCQVAEREGISAWQQDVVTPTHAAAPGALIARVPDFSRMQKDVASFVFPGVTPGENYGINIGALHLAMLTPEYLQPQKIAALKTWLAADMSQAGSRWRAVMLPESLIDERTANMSEPLLGVLGPVFEETGVVLVLGTGNSFYHRSRPIGPNTADARGIRYINLCSLDRKRNADVQKSEATARIIDTEGSLLLFVDPAQISGAFIDADGKELDRFIINDDTEPVLARSLFVGRRERDAAMRREMRAVLRQCFRTTPDPKTANEWPITVFNPTDQPVSGIMTVAADDAAFTLNPKEVRFDLKPRGVTRSTFALTPGTGHNLPNMTVTYGDLQTTTPLVLVPQKNFSLPVTNEKITLDGSFAEPVWTQGSCDPGRFGSLEGRAVSQEVAEARLVTTPTGLAIAFRFPASDTSKAKAQTHDDPIWRESSLEVFVDPENQARRFCHFGLSENGVTFDANDQQGKAWSPTWSQAIRREGNFMHVEMLLPYTTFGLKGRPAPGTVWRINLTRNVPANNKVDVFQLAPTYGPNDRSGLYAAFQFE